MFGAAALAGLIGSTTVHAQSREPRRGLDAYVEAARATWKGPGVAVAIVRNDSIIHARGAIPVTFRLNAAAKVDEVQIDMAGPITFKRRPEAERR